MSLFCYGTLRSATIREKVLGKRAAKTLVQTCLVKGYKVVNVRGKWYPQLKQSEDPNSVAPGTLLKNLGTYDWKILDQFEGKQYKRFPILIFDKENEEEIEAQCYMPIVSLEYDKQWDFEKWERDFIEKFIGNDFNIYGVT
tara:strand:- start:395 stop:817 length:423 start_codon:yes stop_codon:yes gene_type:complete